MSKNRDPRKNHEGYPDPTAYEGLIRADSDYYRLNKVLDIIWAVCEMAGFRVEGRIVLRDKKTGKVWR